MRQRIISIMDNIYVYTFGAIKVLTTESNVRTGYENIHNVYKGTWKSVGSYGFGQAQPGAIVTFDGTHCNFFSPYDNYAFYQDNGQWRLDCTSFLFSETLSFQVEIIDVDLINIYYGSTCTELRRIY